MSKHAYGLRDMIQPIQQKRKIWISTLYKAKPLKPAFSEAQYTAESVLHNWRKYTLLIHQDEVKRWGCFVPGICVNRKKLFHTQ